jgi:hypothetical protein
MRFSRSLLAILVAALGGILFDRSAARAAEPAKPAIDWNAARQFWSFQPIRMPSAPAVQDDSWCRTGVDRFILARLESAGLKPVGPAEKRTLIRRACFDLIGLPPSPAEIQTFLEDDSPDAFAKVIDRLLADPRYGERWGRYWLDVARYAEDQAHTFAVQPYTNAWRYRDWVIEAFNSDMPYDRFVKLQIAADLVEDDTREGAHNHAALGYFGLGAQYYKNSDAARAAADELDDRVDTLGRGFLGLTVSCARCHDHKFDPIPTQDYYSIAGVFSNCKLTAVSMAPKAPTELFQSAQKNVQEAEKKFRDFVAAEKFNQSALKADQLKAYLQAAWKLRLRQQNEPKYTTADQAKQDGLDAATLDRMIKFLAADNKSTRPLVAFEGWRKLPVPSGKTEIEPEVVKTAEAIQAHVQALLAERDHPPAPDQKSKSKEAQDQTAKPLLQGLFAENGVFTVTENDLPKLLAPEKKARLDELRGEFESVKKSLPPAPPMAHGLQEAGNVDLKVYLRGNPAQQGENAPRRFLRILAGDNPPPFTHGSGRLDLAEAIASKDNPLTARVIVNRIWQHHFGRGIVGTPSNFGQLGERPTHPELLDYLAARFLESGWSIKALHRDIMLSSVYQLGAEREPANMLKDPDNRLRWRMQSHRLDVEAYRDSLLAVAGRLDQGFGGPTTDLGSAQNQRRTVYAKVSRHDLNGLLRLFDFPDANITSEARTETTVPQQQLFVLNSPFFVAQARAVADRLRKEETDDEARVRRAYLLLYGRPVKDMELRIGLSYLSAPDDPAHSGKNQLTRWERYAQVLLAANEFLYVD